MRVMTVLLLAIIVQQRVYQSRTWRRWQIVFVQTWIALLCVASRRQPWHAAAIRPGIFVASVQKFVRSAAISVASMILPIVRNVPRLATNVLLNVGRWRRNIP
jgi:uncharacterized membrane protein